MALRPEPSTAQLQQPLQFQTVHGRRSQYLGLVGGLCVALVYAALSTDMTPMSRAAVFTIVACGLAIATASRLRLSGLFVDGDKIISRRFILDRTNARGPALISLSMRWMLVAHQVMASGDLPSGVPAMLRLGELVPAWLRGGTNALLVREAPVRGRRRRGRWQSTGIVWDEDDDAFLTELAAYLDRARGIDAAQTASNPATRRRAREASYPEYATTHGLGAGPSPTVVLLGIGLLVFGLGCMIYALVSGEVAHGELRFVVTGFLPAAIGASIVVAMRGKRTGAKDAPIGAVFGTPLPAEFVGVLVKHGRLVTNGTFVTPGKLTITTRGGHQEVTAVSTRGRPTRLPILRNDGSSAEPNELLVRHPRAAGPEAARWHGTGVFWGTDGAAVLAHLDAAVRDSLTRDDDGPDAGQPLRDAA